MNTYFFTLSISSLSFLVSSVLGQLFFQYFSLLMPVVLVGLIIFFFSDKISSLYEKAWDLFQSFTDSEDEIGFGFGLGGGGFEEDSLSEFMALDDNILQLSTDIKMKFDDVAGNEEGKEELVEVVKFLKDPSSFVKLGASVPKGVLLGGPPGTGKTLLAKAVAGEAGVPFLKVSGSQFVELLVGVGASRVRELFEKARSLSPSIIFIDEIDSIARVRSSNNSMGGGGNDEREQTLNQILIEMDGFEGDSGVVVIAATNRMEILDPAIKRPGRFDREIAITYPNLKERQAILKVHARGKKIKPSVSLAIVAQRTLGFTGADLANLLNEAAILATRGKKDCISMDEINLTIDRIVIGLEGRYLNRVKARQLTAFHEMGHAMIGILLNEHDGIEKVTLVPRGNTQGTTWTVPATSQYTSRRAFVNQIFIGLAGRAAEEMVGGIGECTVGAQQDFARLTRVVRSMILRYAMGRLQELKQESQQRNLYFLGTDVKQEINNIVDNFTTHFIDLTYKQVMSFLEILRPAGERLVDELLLSEEMSGKEVRNYALESISRLSGSEILSNSRLSSLFELMGGDVKKSYGDMSYDMRLFLKELKEAKELEEQQKSQTQKERRELPKILAPGEKATYSPTLPLKFQKIRKFARNKTFLKQSEKNKKID